VHVVKGVVVGLLSLALLVGVPSVQAADSGNYCALGERPGFSAQFDPFTKLFPALVQDPRTCVHPDPVGSGDLHVLTALGLAYWRQNSDSLHFTWNRGEGQEHWALLDGRVLWWMGDSTDPSSDATDLSGCRDAIKEVQLGPDYPGPFTWTWDGFVRRLEPFDGHQVFACLGSEGGMNRNGMYCFLMEGRPIAIEGSGPCIAGTPRREDASTLFVGWYDGNGRNTNTRLRWNGNGFRVVESWRSCGNDYTKPIPADWPSRQVLDYCGYRG
jgi:hypothetical protein